MLFWLRRCIPSIGIKLGSGQNAANRIQEFVGIVQSPEVNIQRVETKQAMPFIARVCVWQSPFILVVMLLYQIVDSIHCQRAVSRELSRMPNVHAAQRPVEGILVWGPRVIGDLDPRFTLRGSVVDVEI